MYLCERNITVGILLLVNNLAFLRDNRVLGPIGKYFQQLIDTKKSRPNLCKLIGEYDLGEKLPNGSYNFGAIRRIQNREMDIYLKYLSAYVDHNIVDLTPIVYTENFLVGQKIEDKSNFNDCDLFFSFFDLNYLIYVLTTMISFFLIVSLMIICSNRRNKILSILNSIFRLKKNQKKYLLILSISFTIFIFFAQQIFLINIKVEKVIASTSDFLLNEDRILKSKLNVFWLKGEPERYLALNSPKKTFLYKLYKNKNFNPPVIIDKRDILTGLKIFNKGFIFLSLMGIRVVSYYFNVFLNLKLFVNENPFFSLPFFFYRIKENTLKTRLIDKSVKMNHEHGIFTKFSKDINNLKYIKNKDKNQVYYSVSEFLSDHTIFEAITFNNLYYLFEIYFIIMIILFIIYIINCLIKISYKHRKLIRRKIKAIKNLILLSLIEISKNLINYLLKLISFFKLYIQKLI